MNGNSHNIAHGRLMIVSNRLPIVVEKEKEKWMVKMGSGGLITALAPVIKNRGGLWLGFPGICLSDDEQSVKKILEEEGEKTGFSLQPVFLTEEEIKLYYDGFSNEIIWPLFHDLVSDCHFDPAYWHGVKNVSIKFAKEIKNQLQKEDVLWIHDYHLMLVGQSLRALHVDDKIGFFLHIPFPSLEIFMKLPWRFEILRALLEYDLLGFQTAQDMHHFLNCVKNLLPDVSRSLQKRVHFLHTPHRETQVGVFPISIDFKEFSAMAKGDEVSWQVEIDQKKLQGKKVVFSCDRLDISKGIPYRLEAIRKLLKTRPDVHEKVFFLQVVIPSRIEIPKYQELKNEIDRLVGEINSQFSKTGWVPIQYLFRSITRKELLSFYRGADIALITPLRDGMNLIAKEFIASNVHENGVLVLSEFAGVASEVQNDAFLINPYDIEGVSETIYNGLNLPVQEMEMRMKRMRRKIQRNDVFAWVRHFLNALVGKDLHDFPLVEGYMPKEVKLLQSPKE